METIGTVKSPRHKNWRVRQYLWRKKSQVISLIFVLFFTFDLLLMTYNYSFAQPSSYIRVAILQNADSINIKVNGTCEIYDLTAKQMVYSQRDLKTTVATYRQGILIAGLSLNTDKILISLKDNSFISINGRNFRGDIYIIRDSPPALLVVNRIELEDYIKGILYHEASHYWPLDTLKAQAIACRTYALYQAGENKEKDFDVTADIYSQVYGGKTSERLRTSRAVEESKGIVLFYQGEVFPAYYHATCAGHTEDASVLWGINILPLKGVVCDFCKDSPHFKWHFVTGQNELKLKLAASGYNVGAIKEIAILDKNNSGRVANLKITGSKKQINISGKDLRNVVGPNIIKSTNFNVSIVNDDVIFEGFGWGHGVGLCQWGAYFMAKQGYNYEQILKLYYPDSELKIYN